MIKLIKEVRNSLQQLQKGNIILYPTDTVWGIGCDATNVKAVTKIYHIKKRGESKSLVILVDSIEMLQHYIPKIPKQVFTILKKATKPTSIIYNNPKYLADNVIANDNTVAIRIVHHEFCRELIHKFGKPIVSTSANITGHPTPKSFKEIDESILREVDYVVNLQQNTIANSPSRIIKIIKDGELEVIRN